MDLRGHKTSYDRLATFWIPKSSITPPYPSHFRVILLFRCEWPIPIRLLQCTIASNDQSYRPHAWYIDLKQQGRCYLMDLRGYKASYDRLETFWIPKSSITPPYPSQSTIIVLFRCEQPIPISLNLLAVHCRYQRSWDLAKQAGIWVGEAGIWSNKMGFGQTSWDLGQRSWDLAKQARIWVNKAGIQLKERGFGSEKRGFSQTSKDLGQRSGYLAKRARIWVREAGIQPIE